MDQESIKKQKKRERILQDEKIRNYTNGKSVLIVDPTSTTRKALRRIISEVGFRSNQVAAVETFEEAKIFISGEKPEIVFADYELGGHTGIELLEVHKKTYPKRLEVVFFLLSSKVSDAVASLAAEEDVDAMLAKPFSVDLIRNKLLDVFFEKSDPSEYVKLIDQANVHLFNDELEAARKLAEEAKTVGEFPTLAFAMLGTCAEKEEDLQEAYEHYEEGLKISATHYKCLMGKFRTCIELKNYEKAYEAGLLISENYPISPRMIPDMVRLAIMNRQLDFVTKNFEVFSELAQKSEVIGRYIAAALVIFGKHLLEEGHQEEAVRMLRQAEISCHKHPAIIKQIVRILIRDGLEKEAEAILERAPISMRDDPEIKLERLKRYNRHGDATTSLAYGLNLIKEGLKDFGLFEICIQRSVQLKRRESLIQELVSAATRSFPERAEDFEKILTEASESVEQPS